MTAAGLILGLVIAAVGSVAGIGAWSAANILSQIERQRRRAKLTPQFEITCTVHASAAGHADLRVILRGPDTLDELDEVAIGILDERWQDHGSRLTRGGPSADDIAKHIWGAWEFNTGASAQVADNPDHCASVLLPDERQRLGLLFAGARTSPPYWASMTQQQSLRRTDGRPLRLVICCRLDDYMWELTYDVP